MITKEKLVARGRPRLFDIDQALSIGEALFHETAYCAVGLSAITEAIGIKAPSFYAAFDNKAAYFGMVLERYGAVALPLDTVLVNGKPPALAMRELLQTAAQTYSADPSALGCLIFESLGGGGDPEIAALARRAADARNRRIRDYIATSHPQAADAVADLIWIAMAGLSAAARTGWSTARLEAAASGAATAVDSILSAPGS